jgi:hypothetical protein
LERSDNLGIIKQKNQSTLKGFAARQTLSGLKYFRNAVYPWFSRRSNHGLKLANAFGVFAPISKGRTTRIAV